MAEVVAGLDVVGLVVVVVTGYPFGRVIRFLAGRAAEPGVPR